MMMNDDPMSVRTYVDALTAPTRRLWRPPSPDQARILDGMAPNVWQGPTATQDWYRVRSVEVTSIVRRTISSR
jgi:hypothetical protein